MSSAPVRDQQAPRSSPARPDAPTRHRRRSTARPKRRHKRVWVAAVALWGAVLLVYCWTAAEYGGITAPTFAGRWLPNAAGGLVTWGGAWANPAQLIGAAIAQPATYGYRNPLRAVSGLSAERIDDGVDFGGVGPVYAVGDGIVTKATGSNYGWPGGGWITYRLTDGPGAGLVVYVAEDISPSVVVGERVTTSTVIGNIWNGGDGIETGWSQASGLSSESELPEAGGIGGWGPFPTRVGANFDELLVSLGVPPAPNYGQTEYGILPLAYPGW